MRLGLVLILLAALCTSCRSDPPVVKTDDPAAVRDTLAHLGRQFSDAYVRGDVAAMMALYTDDAVIFPSNAEFIRGREALERYWTLPEGRRVTHHAMTPVDVQVSGDMASDFGTYEVSGMNGDDAWGPVYGKYVVVWKRGTDGHWRMYLDMWNSRPSPGD